MKFFIPILFAVICMGLGFASGFSTFESIDTWYPTLNKPSFNPPNWIFGPVWTTLYLMMGISAGLIFNLGISKPEVVTALILFTIQLVLNLAWTPVFFGMHLLLEALIIIVLLWIAIVLCMWHFFKLRAICGWLLVPYITWVSFAAVLNFALWRLNS